MTQLWINRSDFGAMLYDLKEQSIKKSLIAGIPYTTSILTKF
jgi:hypothetical protein